MPGLADPAATPSPLDETIIREVWPSIAVRPAAGNLARFCYRTIILAPVAWLALAPLYFKKLLGFLPGLGGLAERYRLTNRRLMVCKGLKPVPDQQVALDQIHDVRLITDANSEFFVSGTLEILGADGRVLMTLLGVPEPESIRQSILQAAFAWGPTLTKRD